jgi:hypothetical protein
MAQIVAGESETPQANSRTRAASSLEDRHWLRRAAGMRFAALSSVNCTVTSLRPFSRRGAPRSADMRCLTGLSRSWRF